MRRYSGPFDWIYSSDEFEAKVGQFIRVDVAHKAFAKDGDKTTAQTIVWQSMTEDVEEWHATSRKCLLDETKEWEGIYDDEDKRLRAGRAHVLACGRMQHRVVTTQHWMTAVEVWRGGVPVFLHVTESR